MFSWANSLGRMWVLGFLFLVGFIVLDRAVLLIGSRIVVSPYFNDQLYSSVINDSTPDVDIIGGCRAALHFDSDKLSGQTGQKFFNAGKVVDGIGNMEFTLQLVLKYQHPKTVFLVLDDGNWEQELEDSRGEIERRLIWWSFLSPESQRSLSKKYLLNPILIESGLWRFKGRGEDLLKGVIRWIVRKPFNPPYKDGFNPRDPEQNVADQTKADDAMLASRRSKLKPSQFARDTIESLILAVQNAHATPVLVTVPMHRYRASDEVNQQQSDLLKEFSTKYHIEHLNYLDNNGTYAKTDPWWSDPGHMNKLGAEEFSAQFGHDVLPFIVNGGKSSSIKKAAP